VTTALQDSALNAFGSMNSAAASPDAATVEAMLPNGPALLLLDELVHPSGNDGLILAQPVSSFASMVQRKGLAMVRLK
jgi:hypothetical protein